MQQSLLTAISAVFALAACGGGSGSGTTSDLTINGVALTGTAIASASVQVKCKVGEGAATTAADGSFSAKIASGVAPCLLRIADPVSATDLHSLLESGTVANISPVTDLVVSKATGLKPAKAFADFSPSVQASITQVKVSDAIEIVKKAISAIAPDADMSDTDPLKAPIKARQGDIAGDANDKKLDALGVALAAADTSLSKLSESLITADKSTVEAQMRNLVGDARFGLPSCPTARSGDVWALDFEGSAPTLWNANFNTNQLKDLATDRVYSISPDSSTPCAFTAEIKVNNTSVKMSFRISDGGIGAWVLTNPANGKSSFGVSVPKQPTRKPTSVEFGGVLPGLFFINIKGSTTRTAAALKYTVDASGNITANLCDTTNIASPSCTGSVPASAASLRCSDSPEGYMSCISEDGKTKAKAVLYSSPGQAVMFMSVSEIPLNEGGTGFGLLVMNKAPVSAPLPPVNTVSPPGWYVTLDASNVVKSGAAPRFTITSSDVSLKTYEFTTEGFDGSFKAYNDNPTLGFRSQTYKSYRSVALGSPTGWFLSVGKGSDSANVDWTIGIRDKQ